MIIRNLTEADYPPVLALYEQLDRIHYEARPDYFGKREVSFPEDAYRQTLSDPRYLMIGAFEGGLLLGLAGAVLAEKSGMREGIRTACLENLYVLPEARRKGVAKGLFGAVETWAKAAGALRLDLHVWDFNRDALALYEAMGMTCQYRVMEKKLMPQQEEFFEKVDK